MAIHLHQAIAKVRSVLEMDAADIASLPVLWRYTSHLFHFCWQVSAKFITDRCIQRASALGYATLLAIVPLLVLGFSVFAGFPVFGDYADKIVNGALQYLVPTSQDALKGYLATVTEKTGALSIFGIVGLLFTVTALLNTVEEAFNDIWRVQVPRPVLAKFVAFWSLLTLSPLLMAVSLSITSYFATMPVLEDVAAGASTLQNIPFLIPWLISSIAITTLYKALPNTNVPFAHALIGGMVAGVLFEASKLGFTFYVTKMANYEKVYGVLGALPVFLIWLYLAWFVVLIGAEVAYCLQHPRQSKRFREWLRQPGVRHFYQYLILLRAGQAFQQGCVLQLDAIAKETKLAESLLLPWAEHLAQQGLLRRLAEPECGWVIARNPALISLHSIHQRLEDNDMDIPYHYAKKPLGSTLRDLYAHVQQERASTMGCVSLQTIVNKENNLNHSNE
jgi:membrane protein